MRGLASSIIIALLAACSGGNDSGPAPTDLPASKAESARFLNQSTYGPNDSSIDRIGSLGYKNWFVDQFEKGNSSHQQYFDNQAAALPADQSPSQNFIFESFWRNAVAGDDQLRQRVMFALSQIFVISMVDDNIANNLRGVASYMDTLGNNSFGNFRKLLEDVSLHPMMGLYLSHLRNQKEDPTRGRVPDENYAREVMQLFTIGLHELNADGTVKLDSRNEPIDTYSNDDVTGLAKVFTGFSWGGGDKSDSRFYGNITDPDRAIKPMQGYPQFHSTSAKTFLGTTIAAQGTASPEASLQVALDRLFNHPNVGPFIGKQMIQHLVTSNPSPAYVARVAAAFANNGFGVRGDMKTLVVAVLMDPEARDPARVSDPNFGKVREPILKLAAWMRAFNAQSATGRYLMGSTDDQNSSLGQSPMRSGSVFNFFRPGYVPPNTSIGALNMVAPELQISYETTAAAYLNMMRSAVANGFGSNSPRDVQPSYSTEQLIANDPDQLIERVNLLLTAGSMTPALKAQLKDAINSVPVPATLQDNARRNRALLAIFLTIASPEYIVQK